MQLSTDSNLAAAVASSQRVFVSEFKVDWARDGKYGHLLSDLTEVVDEIQVRRDVEGALPQQTTLIEGFIGASAAVQLSGTRASDPRPIHQMLSPLRTDSPLYGASKQGTPVRWRLGMVTAAGTVPMIDQFVGYIDQIRIAGNSVILSLLDGTYALHAPINLPIHVSSTYGLAAQSNLLFRINSQWVIDYILRRNGIYQSPPAVTGALWCATGHGAMTPEIGHQFNPWVQIGQITENDPVVVTGRWGVACTASPKYLYTWYGRLNGSFLATTNTSYLVQFQADLTNVGSRYIGADGVAAEQVLYLSTGRGLFTGTTWEIGIRTSGQIYCKFYNGSTLVATVNGPGLGNFGWTDCWCSVSFNSFTNASVGFNNQATSLDLSALNPAPDSWPYSNIVGYNSLPMQCLQVSSYSGGSPNFYSTGFVSQCDLDPGLNEFLSLPVRRGVDSLDLLREVVATEFGVAGFTESGRFFFRNRNRARTAGLTASQTITPEPQLLDLSVSEPAGSVRNNITVKTQIITAPGTAYEPLWTLKSTGDLQAPGYLGYSYFLITLDKPGWVFDTSNLSFVTTANWDDSTAVNQFCAVDGNFTEITGLTVDVIPNPAALSAGQDQVLLRVFNPTTATVNFGLTNGRPALVIGGLPAHTGPELVNVYQSDASVARYGQQSLPLDLSDWRQLSRPLRNLALSLLSDLKEPTPVLDPIAVAGDPRRQPADTVQILDEQGLGGPIWVSLQAIERKLSNGKLDENLTVRAFARPGRWILGHPNYSILGSTTVLG